jgi:hypothetical protein
MEKYRVGAGFYSQVDLVSARQGIELPGQLSRDGGRAGAAHDPGPASRQLRLVDRIGELASE